jgi:uncharacterized protein (DUF58 family)
MPEKLFDERVLRKLEQLTLVASRVRAGVMKGERRSVKRGTSIEFADYREYARGDDLRRVDWNVFARLERPFIKLLEEEEDLAVYLLLDCSKSMDWPQTVDSIAGIKVNEESPLALFDAHKFNFTRRIVAGLAHISLGTGDRLTIAGFSDSGIKQWGPYRGRGRTLDLHGFLSTLEPTGTTTLNQSLKDYTNRITRPGLVILISDLMSPGGYQDGIAALQGRGNEVAVIHALSPDEVSPPINGDLRLIDLETGTGQDVTIDAGMRDMYERRLAEWRAEINAFCTKRGVHYVTIETSQTWESLILSQLRKLGIVH